MEEILLAALTRMNRTGVLTPEGLHPWEGKEHHLENPQVVSSVDRSVEEGAESRPAWLQQQMVTQIWTEKQLA